MLHVLQLLQIQHCTEKQQKLSELKVRNMTAKNEVTMMKQHLRYTSEVNEALESSIRR